MQLEEKILVQELQKGNTKAFELLFLVYHKKLFNFCKLITHNNEDSEGIVQEVFICIWEKRNQLEEELSFSSFLFKIAKNKALNVLKKNLRMQIYKKYLKNDIKWEVQESTDVELTELNAAITESLSRLSNKTRKILLLSRNEGFTHKEIANQLNISIHIVDHEIRKALRIIKTYLHKNYPV